MNVALEQTFGQTNKFILFLAWIESNTLRRRKERERERERDVTISIFTPVIKLRMSCIYVYSTTTCCVITMITFDCCCVWNSSFVLLYPVIFLSVTDKDCNCCGGKNNKMHNCLKPCSQQIIRQGIILRFPYCLTFQRNCLTCNNISPPSLSFYDEQICPKHDTKQRRYVINFREELWIIM